MINSILSTSAMKSALVKKGMMLHFVILIGTGVNSSWAQNTWTQKADFGGIARRSGVGFSIGSKGYIGTGLDGTNFRRDFWEYNPVTNSWTQKVDFPASAREYAVGFSIANKGYIGTGLDASNNKNDFWEYDPSTNAWTNKANVGGMGRWGAVGFSIGSKGYIGTGYDGSDGKNDFWEYDPAINAWTQKANFGGAARYVGTGFSIGSKGYIGTGESGNFPNLTYYNDFWEYNPSTNSWSQKSSFPGTPRRWAVGFSIGNHGYIGTGVDVSDYKSDFWDYDPVTNNWTQKADFAGTARWGANAFSIGNKGYIGTGAIGYPTFFNDFWEYTPVCNGLTVYADGDEDGFGNISNSYFAVNCVVPGGYVVDSSDCDDSKPAINPLVSEISGDGIDNNCNSIQDENHALDFNGVNNFVQKNNTSLPLGNSPRTMEAWVKTVQTNTGVILNWGNITNNQRCAILVLNGKLYFAGEYNDISGTITINDGLWHHVAVTFDGTNMRGYVDGVQDISTTKALNTVGTSLRIGKRAVSEDGEYFNGKIDEVRIWNITRSQAAIQTSMNLIICSSTTGLVAYFPFNQGIAAGDNPSIIKADDVTPNNNNGTLQNFQLTGPTSNWVSGTPGLIAFNNASLYQDTDGDGYGNPSVSQIPTCDIPTGYVLNNLDCDDNNSNINPNVSEIINGIDDNCDGFVDANFWTQKSIFGGTARYFAVGFSIGSKGYIGTGSGTDGVKKDFWEYEPSTNVWSQKADFGGIARAFAVGFSIGNKGYIGTGGSSNDFWEYDPITNMWTAKANFGGAGRPQAVGFSIGNKGYIGTGNKDVLIFFKDFWEYDPSNDTWTKKANFRGRIGAVGFSIGNKGYIGTGYNGDDYFYANDFWEYNPETDAWTQKANLAGIGRDYAVGFSIGSKGYISTGEYPDYYTDYETKDLWEYDPSTNTWIQKADFGGTARYGAVGFSIGTKGYLGTGRATDGYKNDFWEYTPDNSITTGTISGSPFCPEAIVNVPFTSIGTFNAGNIYTAQLSDKTGNFSSLTTIGSLSSTANSGTIIATLPSKPKAGTKYRIRVISSDPVVTDGNNGSNLELYACAKVTALSASPITSTSATLNWTGVSCTANYKVQYRKQNTNPWTTTYLTTNSHTIIGLLANTVYDYRIETYCSMNGSSNSGYTAIQQFTTAMRLALDSIPALETISIYPNPAVNQTIIQFTLQRSSNVSIKMYDVSGNEIEMLLNDRLKQGGHSLRLNTNDFSKGFYYIQMITSSGIQNRKLIVQ